MERISGTGAVGSIRLSVYILSDSYVDSGAVLSAVVMIVLDDNDTCDKPEVRVPDAVGR